MSMSDVSDGIRKMVSKVWRIQELFCEFSGRKSNCEWWDTAIPCMIMFFIGYTILVKKIALPATYN